MNVSTCISNVAGPDFPLYCAGAKMVDYYGLGVLTPAMGIFHLVFSYAGNVTLSVLADRDIMPDPETYHDFLVSSFEELYRAALGHKAAGQQSASLAEVSPKRDSAGKARSDGKSGTRAKAKAGGKSRTSAKTKAKAVARPAARPKSPAAGRPRIKTKTAKARPKAKSRKAASKR
jgi:hypothetical protein